MNIRPLTEADALLLEEFVAAHPHGSIEQTWNWGELQCTIPGRDAFFAFGVFAPSGRDKKGKKDKEEELIGSMLVIRQEAGRGKTWLWAPMGPLLPENQAEEAWEKLKSAAEKLAQKGGDLFLRVEPGWEIKTSSGKKDSQCVETLDLGGYESSESYVPRHSLVVDLKGGPEDLLKQMKQKGRYNIKQAEKADVYVKRSNGEDYDAFYEMLVETAERDGFHLHNREFYFDMLDGLGESARLYLAYHEHELLGGLIATHFGKTVNYYFGASSNMQRSKRAPYLLQWVALQEALKLGYERYDFLGIAAFSDVKWGESGFKAKYDKKDSLVGVTQFKTRFGGRPVAYEKARVFVYRPLWWMIYHLVRWMKRMRV
jgi:peptidoglycan pentaglycine glycine transferase (the first glycine)